MTRLLLLCLLPSVALAQAIAPEYANRDITPRSIAITSGQKITLDGQGGSRWLMYNSGTGGIDANSTGNIRFLAGGGWANLQSTLEPKAAAASSNAIYVGGFHSQFEKTYAGAPTSAECDNALELGRGPVLDTTNNLVCNCFGSAGWKCMPASPPTGTVAIVQRATAQTLSSATPTVIQYNSEVLDQASAFDTSTYTYTVPVTGIYSISACMTLEAYTAGGQLIIWVYVGGAERVQLNRLASSTNGNNPGVCGTQLVSLTAADAVTIVGYQSSGGNKDIYNSGSLNQLSIAKVF